MSFIEKHSPQNGAAQAITGCEGRSNLIPDGEVDHVRREADEIVLQTRLIYFVWGG
jgi:hypothetical protein